MLIKKEASHGFIHTYIYILIKVHVKTRKGNLTLITENKLSLGSLCVPLRCHRLFCSLRPHQKQADNEMCSAECAHAELTIAAKYSCSNFMKAYQDMCFFLRRIDSPCEIQLFSGINHETTSCLVVVSPTD